MPGRLRLPPFAVAFVLLGLILALGALQYRWLGQISSAERDRMRASLAASADGFAGDLDAELTRAYLLFQTMAPGDDDVAQMGAHYDRWQAAARFPRLLSAFYCYTAGPGDGTLERFDPATRTLRPAPWPASMAGWRERLRPTIETQREAGPGGNRLFVRRLAPPLWEEAAAIVVPVPRLLLADSAPAAKDAEPAVSYTILQIDRDYLAREMLPALAAEHFKGNGDAAVNVAVVRGAQAGDVLYRSNPSYRPVLDKADVKVGLFSIRTQDFDRVAAEVRHVTTLATAIQIETGKPARGREPMAIFVQRADGGRPLSPTRSTTMTQVTAMTAPSWTLVLQHPAGSLEAAVASARRRNLLVSTSILGVLGASMALLVLSTRRAQQLARRQMEFVATVSHELRTPLAVLRSAADNLADGVVDDRAQVRRYGEVMRAEGRRLTEMVEQVLEFAGLASGQRALRRDPVALEPLLRELVEAARPLAGAMRIELELPAGLPPVAGDEAALRRVFQNLIANALKYGADGGWVGIAARAGGGEVITTIADRGIGIDPAEHERIFEPFYRTPAVLAAQVQGAGLGLSLVRRIVQAHGGRVTVDSRAGAGAVFAVHLKTADHAAADATAAVAPGAQAPRYS